MVAVVARRMIAVDGHRRGAEEDMVSENEGPASPDLADRAGRRVAQVTQVQAVLGGQHGR
jgi:hypothetical protein